MKEANRVVEIIQGNTEGKALLCHCINSSFNNILNASIFVILFLRRENKN